MLDPRNANNLGDCLAIAMASAGDYPLCLGWQVCLEPLLPPLMRQGRCLAFFVDEEMGPHFVVDEGGCLADVPVSEAGFAEPLDEVAELWLSAFAQWRCGQLSFHRQPLQLV